MAQRRILPCPPRLEIDEIAIRWMTAFARRNYWRVASFIAFDDLLQEGYFTWYRIVAGQMRHGSRKKHGGISAMCLYKYVTDRKQIMGLFMQTYEQHITDLAAQRTRLPLCMQADVTYSDDGAGLDIENMTEEALEIPVVYKRAKAVDEDRYIEAINILVNKEPDRASLQNWYSREAKRKYHIERARTRRLVVRNKNYTGPRDIRRPEMFRVIVLRTMPFPSYFEWWDALWRRFRDPARQNNMPNGMLESA